MSRDGWGPLMNHIVRVVLLLAAIVLGMPRAFVTAETRGLRLSDRTVVEGDDSRALTWNPAGLGFLDGLDLQYVHTGLGGSQAVGGGDGVFLAAQLLGPLRIGTAYQFLIPPGGGTRDFRFTFGSALGLGRVVSFGFNLHRLTSDTDPTRDGLLSLDLGLMWRPLSWLALGASVSDLNTPRRSGGRLSRGYELGVGFRPGTERLVLGLEGRLDESARNGEGRFRISFAPLLGMTVGAALTMVPRRDSVEYMVESFLGLSLGYASAAGGMFLGGGDSATFDGFSVAVRASSRRAPALVRPRGQAVVVTLDGALPEGPRAGLFASPTPTFSEVVVALESLGSDSRVSAVLLELRGSSLGWAQTAELRRVLTGLRAGGKTVVVHALTLDSRQLLLAGAADHILLHPGGGVLPTGLRLTSTYLRAALDKLGVRAEFVAIGAYKSYPEMFTHKEPSEQSDEVRDAILDGLYEQLVAGLAAGREMAPEAVRALIDGGPLDAAAAVNRGLVDALAFEDELQPRISELVGRELRLRRDWFRPRAQESRWGAQPHIAVVTIEGTIIQGRSRSLPLPGMSFAGADTLRETLDALVADSSVKGILVRINSRGGNSLASERMHRAIAQAAQKKPLVVSFGDAAASGGYYAACGAPTVIAEASTLTGSIGIFAGKFVWSGLLTRLGVGREVRIRGAQADLMSPDRRWSDEQRALVERRLEALYDLFLERVAEGRQLSAEAVHEVAQGRVWLGAEALELGLVDRHGGVREGLFELAERAHMSGLPAIAHYPRRGWLARLKLARGEAVHLPRISEEHYGLLASLVTQVTAGGESVEWATLIPAGLQKYAALVLPLLGLGEDDSPLALLPAHYELR